ncbi:MAG: hypothetical protein IKU71_10755 [Kiritimatiellae bacterium]|nr:hypothetical protein [Kiritimatiellia bacterium]
MKAIKVIGKILLWTLAIVVVLLLALPLWIGPVVKGVANTVAPRITGTDFHLGEFGLNPYTGTLHVGDMQLANPTNFSEKNAVDLKSFDVDFAMTSLVFGKKYRVESVEVDGIVIHSDFPKGDNFMQILENATGDEAEPEAEAQEGEQPDVEPKAPKAEETAEIAKSEQAEEDESKGVQIDRITLKNVTIKYGLPVKIPMDIELTGIGAESEYGASFAEVWDAVFTKVKSALTAVGGAIGDLGKGAASALKDAGGATADSLKDAGGAAADSIKDASGAAADALKSAGDGLKGLFKK